MGESGDGGGRAGNAYSERVKCRPSGEVMNGARSGVEIMVFAWATLRQCSRVASGDGQLFVTGLERPIICG